MNNKAGDTQSKGTPVWQWVAVCGVLILAGYLRMQGVATLAPGEFTETDAYLYAHQAQIVSDHGYLPDRDMRRWVPLGRDTRQSLNLYPIVMGYAHKGVQFLFPDVSVAVLIATAPVICFCLFLAVVCGVLARLHGFGVSLTVGVILATLPGTIERSAYGFGDRDSWCLLIGGGAVFAYLMADALTERWHRLYATLLSGILMFCGGLSWEGFGVFSCVVVCRELWRFLTTDTEADLGRYACWVGLFVPLLYLVSPAYRNGEGWATHLFAFMLVPPVALLGLRLARAWLCVRSPWASVLKPHARHVSLGLLLVGLSLACGYLLTIRQTFAETTVPFGETALMQSVGELVAPHFGYWPYRYGGIFLTGSLGLVLFPVLRWGRPARHLTLALLGFCITTFFRHAVADVFGPDLGDAFFAIALGAVGLAFVYLGWPRPETAKAPAEGVPCDIAMLCWAVCWMALARDAKRYDFFIGLPLAYFTATLIRHLAAWVFDILRNPMWTTPGFHEKLKALRLNTSVLTGGLLCVVMVWGPIDGGHIFRAHAAAAHLRHAVPGRGPLPAAYAWMKTHLPETSVVAAEWSYGTQLNVLGGVRSIVGPDHYRPSWIALYQQHVARAQTEQEVLTFLFTHDVTHLMVTTEKQPEQTLLRRGSLSGAFVPRYPASGFENAPVKVWELRYPPGSEKRPEYLSDPRERW